MRPFISRRWVCCWSDDCRIAATAAFWKVASGFDSSAERELLEQLLARLAEQLGHRGAHLVLHGGVRLGAEVALEHARHVPVVGPEGLLELRLELGHHGLRRVLEVPLEDLDGGAGLLAVEHPGADLDRVGDQPRGILAGVGAGAHELGGERVVDHEVLDDHAADQRGDAGVAQGCCSGFHGLDGG